MSFPPTLGDEILTTLGDLAGRALTAVRARGHGQEGGRHHTIRPGGEGLRKEGAWRSAAHPQSLARTPETTAMAANGYSFRFSGPLRRRKRAVCDSKICGPKERPLHL